jgi:hypothetical protein
MLEQILSTAPKIQLSDKKAVWEAALTSPRVNASLP